MTDLNVKPLATSKRQRRLERQRRRRQQWFHQYEVEYFIRQEYPGCPEIAVVRFASQICTERKNWQGASIGEAVDLTMQNLLRHEFTDYDQMMMVGVRRKEVRQRVQPKIHSIVASWKETASSLATN